MDRPAEPIDGPAAAYRGASPPPEATSAARYKPWWLPRAGSATPPTGGAMEGGEDTGSTAAELQPAGSAAVGHLSAGSMP